MASNAQRKASSKLQYTKKGKVLLNKAIVKILNKKGLSHLVPMFKQMVYLVDEGEIKIPGQSWKVINRVLFLKDDDDFWKHNTITHKKYIESTLMKYFFRSGFYYDEYINLSKKRNDAIKKSSIRVKRHREKVKDSGHKNISVSLDLDIFEKLNAYKKENDLSYAGAIEKLLKKS